MAKAFATVLIIAADIERDNDRSVNVTLLKRAFANKSANDFALAHNDVLIHDGDTGILHCTSAKH